MENAVIYARYSSDRQRDVSIEDQLNICKKYAVDHKLSVIKTYADHAMTGTNDKRPLFKKMIADSSRHLFKYVLVYKTDRFARNRFDAAINKKKLKDNGVKFVSVMEPIPEGVGGIVLEAIYEADAEGYSKGLSENVNRGLNSNAEKGLANCKPPFGFSIDQATRHYIIDPVKGPIIKKVFAMAAAGVPSKDVLKYLAGLGYKYSYNWLYVTLKNERYKGIYIWRNHRIPGGMPQLVSEETFNAVAGLRKKRKIQPHADSRKYLLTGKIFCGKCAAKMNGGYSIGRHGGKFIYYNCKNHKAGKCKLRRVKAVNVERAVVLAVKSTVFKPENVEKLAAGVIAYQHKVFEDNSNILAIESHLKDVEKRLANMVKAIEMGVVTETTTARLKELEKSRAELLAQQDGEKLKEPTLTKDEIVNFILSFKDGSVDDPNYCQQLVNTFVTRVFIYGRWGVVCYDFTGEENSTVINFEEGVTNTHYGGDEGSRTPVRKYCHTTFSERIQ